MGYYITDDIQTLCRGYKVYVDIVDLKHETITNPLTCGFNHALTRCRRGSTHFRDFDL